MARLHSVSDVRNIYFISYSYTSSNFAILYELISHINKAFSIMRCRKRCVVDAINFRQGRNPDGWPSKTWVIYYSSCTLILCTYNPNYQSIFGTFFNSNLWVDAILWWIKVLTNSFNLRLHCFKWWRHCFDTYWAGLTKEYATKFHLVSRNPEK